MSKKNLIQSEIFEHSFETSIGCFLLKATKTHLVYLDFIAPNKHVLKSSTTHSILKMAEKQLKEYVAKKRTEFDLPLDFQGTDFQKKVWKLLLKIPYGKTVSYKDLALKMGGTRFSRAVGGAVGKNPLAVFIPCHRVLATNGGIGGFSGGLSMKRKLLAIENHQI